MNDPLHYQSQELLRDGTSIVLRSVSEDDLDRVIALFERMSPRSLYHRFFRSSWRPTAEEVRPLVQLDTGRHAALAATWGEGPNERVVGIGHYYAIGPDDLPTEQAEVAFAVEDAWQGRGIGSLLLDRLAELARANGIPALVADVLGENNRMMRVFEQSGLRVTRSLEGGVFHVALPTDETDASLRAGVERERTAAAASMRSVFRPRSVAVVGASRREGSIGRSLLENLKKAGFQGPIFPVNPSAAEVSGLQAFPDLASVPERVELAIISVPARCVEEVIADCVRAEVSAVCIISSGFAEVSPAGRAVQDRVRDTVRAHGMRLVGPNCMGLLNTDPKVSLNATFAPTWPPAGNVGMLSQSGALGLAILDYARKLHIGISTFVSVGNRADVSSNDVLAYWADDPSTDVVLLYLESFGNPRRFARLAPEVARKKPIVCVKSGRSAAGTRAASSHSAALANLDVAADALFEQCGVIRTRTLEELFDVAALLATQPAPKGGRVGVVTNAGGPGILLADACEAERLELPRLAPETVEALRPALSPDSSLTNPVDMTAAASPEQFERTIEVVGRDPSVDALIVIYIPPFVTDPEAVAAAIARAAGTVPAEKPVLTVFLSSRGAPPLLSQGPRGALPSYSFPENAALALGAAVRYARWKERPRGEPVHLSRFAREAVRAVCDRALAGAEGRVWLAPDDVAVLLRAAGIEIAASELARPEDAVGTAERVGYPLVAKLVSRDLVHKSDIGGVILGLSSGDEVRAAVAQLEERAKAAGVPLDGVLLQRQVGEGIEMLLGVTSDPVFGPLVVCGLGGVLAEALKDVGFALPPVTDKGAEALIGRLRASKLLAGYRGRPPGDRAALIETIRRLSALTEYIPELVEMDLNPLVVLPPGEGAVAVDARIRLDPALRR